VRNCGIKADFVKDYAVAIFNGQTDFVSPDEVKSYRRVYEYGTSAHLINSIE